ncbi:hypothetical protein CDAR_592121 [Caerostris darwini]|uniref:Uncharacterized protein n=1 Tax=Caerostris darwini TaxID=1538125 RepID=A0AAV4W4S8_9ARAC|nr:hypothetical protein CDAR_592121 [Caerostris darwini]
MAVEENFTLLIANNSNKDLSRNAESILRFDKLVNVSSDGLKSPPKTHLAKNKNNFAPFQIPTNYKFAQINEENRKKIHIEGNEV